MHTVHCTFFDEASSAPSRIRKKTFPVRNAYKITLALVTHGELFAPLPITLNAIDNSIGRCSSKTLSRNREPLTFAV